MIKFIRFVNAAGKLKIFHKILEINIQAETPNLDVKCINGSYTFGAICGQTKYELEIKLCADNSEELNFLTKSNFFISVIVYGEKSKQAFFGVETHEFIYTDHTVQFPLLTLRLIASKMEQWMLNEEATKTDLTLESEEQELKKKQEKKNEPINLDLGKRKFK